MLKVCTATDCRGPDGRAVRFHAQASALFCSGRCKQRASRQRNGSTPRPKHVRDDLDRFYTDPGDVRPCVQVLLPAIVELAGRGDCAIVEPSVGDGAWIAEVHAAGVDVPFVALDVDPDAGALRRGQGDCQVLADFATWRPRFFRVGGVIGNPPYKFAEAHIRHALELTQGGLVAFLLRTSILGSRKRRPLWAAHPARVIRILSARPSFTADGKTDSAEYALFVWGDRILGEVGVRDIADGPLTLIPSRAAS